VFATGSHNVVPLLAGVNDGEGLFFVRPDRIFTSVEEQRAARTAEFGPFAGNLLDYYVADSDAQIFDVEVAYNTDSWFARPTREILDANRRAGAPTFMYVFTRNLRDPSLMAPHAMELRYVFNTLPADAPQPDQELSTLMNDYWTTFAATGNPNTGGLPAWPAYDLEQQTHKILGVEGGEGTGFHRRELDELARYFRERYDSVP
jgi:para-nitrobenzyl esterase